MIDTKKIQNITNETRKEKKCHYVFDKKMRTEIQESRTLDKHETFCQVTRLVRIGYRLALNVTGSGFGVSISKKFSLYLVYI